MPKWEYLTKFCEANAKDKHTRDFLKQNFSVKRPPAFTPESMIPELNALGEDGWELVHMEPVARVGSNGDVLFDGSGSHWSNIYFCVFKRQKAEPEVKVEPPQETPAEIPMLASQILPPPDRPILPPGDEDIDL
ncbi:MAG: hypothetical protein SF029_03005 [bacterium]|nr:hypothetical protein [bacterium]